MASFQISRFYWRECKCFSLSVRELASSLYRGRLSIEGLSDKESLVGRIASSGVGDGAQAVTESPGISGVLQQVF